MEYFWLPNKLLPDGVGFSHFDGVHIFWLALLVVAAVVNSLWYRRLGDSGRRVWRATVAALLVADELFKQIGLIAMGCWDPSYLPLHLCSINIFLIVWHAIRPNATLGNFLYTVCIPGAVAALLFPTWTKQPMANFMHIHSFTVHTLLALYPIVLTAGGDIRPDHRRLPKCIGILVVMAVAAYFLNPPLDANFFFMASASSGNPLYWFEENWGSHYLGFPVLVVAVLLVMHGPVYLFRRLQKAKAA